MQKTLIRHMMMVLLGCNLFLLAPLCTSFTPSLDLSVTKRDTTIIQLDCANISGRIHPFAEINDGPMPVKNKPHYVDITDQYQQIGITSIRTHDLFGPTDISTIFPNWSADPSIESNYHFETSDVFITSMIDAGCEVFYRLGESASANNSLREPPANFTKWAEVCKHITMHYNEGWHNGFYYNILYWEIWNEPDLSGFWNGTADQYYELYHITADTIKTHNSSLKVGGPCTSSVSNVNYTEGFLRHVRDHEVPLDFFSWHHYAATPNSFYIQSQYVRLLLDSFGFPNAENINTEWNINILTPQRDKDNAKNAAFTACSLTVFQDAQLDSAFRYRGNQDNNLLMRFLGLDLSLFSYKGVYKRPALVYRVMKDVTKDTPLRLATQVMDASTGITYLAGISEDKTNVSVLISNFDTPDTQYTLRISNIPWENTYTVAKYLIDERHHLQIKEKATYETILYEKTDTITSNSVLFYRFTNSSVFPQEGPEVAKIPFLLRLRILDPLARLLTFLIFLFFFG